MKILLFILLIYIIVRILLYLIVKIYGKFSFKGFSSFGFNYDAKKDIFYPTRNAWQKNFGYTHIYDVFAPIASMILDREVIKFKYDNKHFLVILWKGQYGITTGAEIGIYYTEDKKVNKHTIYEPYDEDNIHLSFILYKNKKVISCMEANHWWLAMFKLGMFSHPHELSMDIKITFKDQLMLIPFTNALKKLGYDNLHLYNNNTCCFYFNKPFTFKVITRMWLTDKLTQHRNKLNVKLYNEILLDYIAKSGNYPQTEKNIIINNLIPDFFQNDYITNNNVKVSIQEYL